MVCFGFAVLFALFVFSVWMFLFWDGRFRICLFGVSCFGFCLIGGFDYADLLASYIAAMLDLLRFVLVGLGLLCVVYWVSMGLGFAFVL